MVVQSAIGPPVEEARGSAEAFRAGATQPSPRARNIQGRNAGTRARGGSRTSRHVPPNCAIVLTWMKAK